MLNYRDQLRFTKDELAQLKKLCGSAYQREPKSVDQYNAMITAAQAECLAGGDLRRVKSLEAMRFQDPSAPRQQPRGSTWVRLTSAPFPENPTH